MQQKDSKDISLIDQIFSDMFSIIKDKPEFNAEIIQDLETACKNRKFKKIENILEILRRPPEG
jgi:hypothetical protein